MTRTRYRVCESRQPHFLTCTIVGWQPIFALPGAVQVVLESWRYLQERGRLTIFGFVILENHLHWIASSDDLAKEVGDFKSFTARQIIEQLESKGAREQLEILRQLKAKHKTDRDYQLWQEGSHPQIIESNKVMWQKLEYIHNNPVRRGYVDDPAHWRYSSARNYNGEVGLISVTTDWR